MSEETKPPTDKPADAPPPVEEPTISLEELDSILDQEDPGFNNEFAVLREEKFEVEIEIESFKDVDQAMANSAQAPTATEKIDLKSLKSNPAQALKLVVNASVDRASRFVRGIFASIGAFFGLSLQKKALVMLVVAMILSGVVLAQKALMGPVLPNLNLKFLSSFKSVADRSFKIEPGEQMEDFDNPLRHPDFVVLIERLVVNLRSSQTSENPMGMFEFYVEASSQEGAIEINERQKEIRDLMARTLESTTYDDLATTEGKDRMKLALRRELNTLLTEGRVRRVFFKTILLKP